VSSIMLCIWAVASFQATFLTYGKRPALRDLIKVLGQA
jgi:hypothetical protein